MKIFRLLEFWKNRKVYWNVWHKKFSEWYVYTLVHWSISILLCYYSSWNIWKQVLIWDDLLHFWQRILQFFLQTTHLQTSHCIGEWSELSVRTSAGKVYDGPGFASALNVVVDLFVRICTIVRIWSFCVIFLLLSW